MASFVINLLSPTVIPLTKLGIKRKHITKQFSHNTHGGFPVYVYLHTAATLTGEDETALITNAEAEARGWYGKGVKVLMVYNPDQQS